MGGFWLRRKNFLGVEAYCILCPTSMSLMTDSYSGLSEVHRYLRRRIHLCLLRRTFPTRRLAGLNPKCFCIFKYQSCKCIVHWLARGLTLLRGACGLIRHALHVLFFQVVAEVGLGNPRQRASATRIHLVAVPVVTPRACQKFAGGAGGLIVFHHCVLTAVSR